MVYPRAFSIQLALPLYSLTMANKWSNRSLPGALHFVTGAVTNRMPVFREESACSAFINVTKSLRSEWPFKLIAYVLVPDNIHLILNPADGRIRELMASLKSLSAKNVVKACPSFDFRRTEPDRDGTINQVWQESFKALPLWSDWMIWQNINYVHSNPVKAGLSKSADSYSWSSFRSFYQGEPTRIGIDREWWWPDDVRKLSVSAKEWSREIVKKAQRGSRPDSGSWN